MQHIYSEPGVGHGAGHHHGGGRDLRRGVRGHAGQWGGPGHPRPGTDAADACRSKQHCLLKRGLILSFLSYFCSVSPSPVLDGSR